MSISSHKNGLHWEWLKLVYHWKCRGVSCWKRQYRNTKCKSANEDSRKTRILLVKSLDSINLSHPWFCGGIWGNEIRLCSFCVTRTIWLLSCCTAVIEGLAECAVLWSTYSTSIQHFCWMVFCFFSCDSAHLYQGDSSSALCRGSWLLNYSLS